ncbi:VCBS repeat-containing protein [Dactylosporangium vinaceum]|uniref:FG-GAP-like repeat-containing protein n=1 Tax=Dactylosporangium vinaceum TaxID=53362 RepID=A0ABV5M2D5_9ACTN|nr:FG-GAP-like repeat-containing protein [Dactylosporangium vinaceum]UAB96212.1 VCBS repeat-containing protein [Dactylosporangium vinaceum]
MLLRRTVAVACVLGAAALNPLGSPASAAPPAEHKLATKDFPGPGREDLAYDPHAVLVQFKPGTTAASSDRAVKSRNAQVSGTVAGARFVKVTTAGTATDLLRDLSRDPAVASASLDYRRRASTTPNDPGYTEGAQDYLNTVRLPQAWDRTTGSADQIIAVVDSGVDGQHPDLTGRVLAGYNAITGTTIAAGANSDDYGHGTMVAGIAAARTDNLEGVAGVAWNSRILPVKVLNASGEGYDSSIAAGIVWAADHGAKVVNLSLGGPGDSAVVHDAVIYATNKGALVVASAGNDGDAGNATNYPAAFPEVLAVAATDGAGKVTDFSTYGDWVDVAAPGFDIVSTGLPDGDVEYYIGAGTSFAAPIVSGVAALMRSTNPALTPAQLMATIKGTARDAGPRGLDPYYGAGVLDAYAAVGGPWAPQFPPPNPGTDEPNDVPARATPFADSIAGTIGAEGDVDWYRYDSISRRKASVRVTPAAFDASLPQHLDPVLEVYDQDLRLIGTAFNPDPAVATQVDFEIGAGPYYLAVRNHNGAADARPYTLAVTLGADAQFGPAQTVSPGSRAQSVAIGDVTGDGRDDVILATNAWSGSANNYRLFVYPQNTDGTLGAPAMYPTQLEYISTAPIAVLDANGDGRKDVALGTVPGVELFTQTAAGALTDSGLVPGTGGVQFLTAADMDGDGDGDLVASFGLGVQLLTQEPAGTFTASTVTLDAGLTEDIAVGDVDGDGRPDVVGFGHTAINVYHHTATRWIRTDHNAVQADQEHIASVAVADVTGDGRADVIAGVGAAVEVFAQTAAGGLAVPAVHRSVSGAGRVEAADFNGDGRADVMVRAGGGFGVLHQRADGSLGPIALTSGVNSDGSGPNDTAVGDVDGDNRIDVAIAAGTYGLGVIRSAAPGPAASGEQAYVRSTGVADFATGVALDARPTVTFARAVDASAVRLVHGVTGQPVAATVAFDARTGTVTVTPAAALQDNTAYRLVVDGAGFSSTFRTVDTDPAAVTNLQANGASAAISWTAPAITDLDQVIVRAAAGSAAPSSVTAGIGLYAGSGTGFTAANLTPGTAYTVRAFTKDRSGKVTAGPSVSLTVSAYKLRVDFNGDGNTDVAGIDANSDIKLYRGDGTGKLVGNDGYMWPAGGLWNGFRHIVAADFNGDGRVDIAGIDANNDIKLYTGDGTGKLVGNGSYMWPTGGLWGGFKKIFAGDFNNDGKVDIAGIDANSDLKYYTGDGTGKLVGNGAPMWVSGGLWAGFRHMEAADFNNDGRTDIAGIDANNDIKVYFGDGAGHLNGIEQPMWPTGGLWAGFRYIVAGDFNNDGKADIAGIDANSDIRYYTGDGTGKLVGAGNAMWPTGGLWAGFKQLT